MRTRIAESGGASAPEFVPVILGGHVGAYSLARAFHEGYGVRSLVVTGGDTWVTDHFEHHGASPLPRPPR